MQVAGDFRAAAAPLSSLALPDEKCNPLDLIRGARGSGHALCALPICFMGFCAKVDSSYDIKVKPHNASSPPRRTGSRDSSVSRANAADVKITPDMLCRLVEFQLYFPKDSNVSFRMSKKQRLHHNASRDEEKSLIKKKIADWPIRAHFI